MIPNVWIAFLITLLVAFCWSTLVTFCTNKGKISLTLSRKVMHIGTGPIFALCWLLFPVSVAARWLAALIPFVLTLKYLLVGFGVWKDEAFVRAVSRNNCAIELLQGPTYYGLSFCVLTALFWTHSPIGIISLMILSAGDGFAEIIGVKFAKHSLRIPWAKGKTLVGSLGMFVFGFLFAFAMSAVFCAFGFFGGQALRLVLPILLLAVAGTLMETLPWPQIDNITVPLLSTLLGVWMGL